MSARGGCSRIKCLKIVFKDMYAGKSRNTAICFQPWSINVSRCDFVISPLSDSDSDQAVQMYRLMSILLLCLPISYKTFILKLSARPSVVKI